MNETGRRNPVWEAVIRNPVVKAIGAMNPVLLALMSLFLGLVANIALSAVGFFSYTRPFTAPVYEYAIKPYLNFVVSVAPKEEPLRDYEDVNILVFIDGRITKVLLVVGACDSTGGEKSMAWTCKVLKADKTTGHEVITINPETHVVLGSVGQMRNVRMSLHDVEIRKLHDVKIRHWQE